MTYKYCKCTDCSGKVKMYTPRITFVNASSKIEDLVTLYAIEICAVKVSE